MDRDGDHISPTRPRELLQLSSGMRLAMISLGLARTVTGHARDMIQSGDNTDDVKKSQDPIDVYCDRLVRPVFGCIEY